MKKLLVVIAIFVAIVFVSSISAQRPAAGSQITGVSGDGNTVVTTKGPQVSGNGVVIDAFGNHIDSGSPPSSGSSNWGGIGGTLGNQTDLAAALAAKQALLGANTVTASAYTSASGQSVEMTVTDTIPYTALIAASTTATLTGVTLPAGFKARGITITEVTGLAGITGLTAGTVSLGPAGNTLAYFPATSLFQTSGTFVDQGGHFSTSAAAVTLLYTFFNTSGATNWGNGTTTSLTAGSITVKIYGVI